MVEMDGLGRAVQEVDVLFPYQGYRTIVNYQRFIRPITLFPRRKVSFAQLYIYT